MAITFEATFENGVIRPDRPINLGERARLHVTVEHQVQPLAVDELTPLDPNDDPFDAVIGIGKGPRDGADNHDHYIYNTPKRTGE